MNSSLFDRLCPVGVGEGADEHRAAGEADDVGESEAAHAPTLPSSNASKTGKLARDRAGVVDFDAVLAGEPRHGHAHGDAVVEVVAIGASPFGAFAAARRRAVDHQPVLALLDPRADRGQARSAIAARRSAL